MAKLISANPNEAKALVKLTSIDVLKSLGGGKYEILLDNKNLTAQSDKQLSEGAKYWTQYTQEKNNTPKLSNLIQKPEILKNFQYQDVQYTLKDVETILKAKNPQSIIKENILDKLSNATTKEEFSNLSTLLLSLQNQTLTIPLNYHNFYTILQLKKRYNKKTKRTQLSFYAALEFLGPISGVVSLENNDVTVSLSVAFDKTKNFLENDMNNLSYNLNIFTTDKIEPLYNANINSLLDVSI